MKMLELGVYTVVDSLEVRGGVEYVRFNWGGKSVEQEVLQTPEGVRYVVCNGKELPIDNRDFYGNLLF